MLTIDELRGIAADLLEAGADELGDHDDLIELGLDSIRCMRIAGRFRRQGLEVGFADLARRPTLAHWAQLAAAATATEPRARPDVAAVAADEPFALAPMQHAYWIGRDAGQALGAVGAHLYTEFDGHGVDPHRLGRAVAALADRHEMLRARVRGDGRQEIGPRGGGDAIATLDLRDAAPEQIERRLRTLRDELSHQRLDLERGQVFDVRLTLLPEQRTRVHVDVDFFAADARSYRILLAELAHLYERPAEPLPALRYRYAQYLADRAAEPPRAEDVRWWRARLGDLPGAPDLPWRPPGEAGDPHRVIRLHRHLEPAQRAGLGERARRHAVTPAVAVATAFAEVLGAWSGEPRFLLNVPTFDRRPLHPDVDAIVGDFTGSILLDVDLREPLPFADRARALQERLHAAIAHGSYAGLDVLRDLARERGEQVLAPVVFTSALDVGELFGADFERCLGDPVWIVSQGPQVVLDAQVSELHDGLLVNWDVREHSFPEGVADAMFAAFAALLDAVADGSAWGTPVGQLLPAGQVRTRERANATDGRPPARPLHAAAFALAGRRPQAPAVLAAGEQLTYGELADRALRVAAALTQWGVVPGDAVAIRLPRGAEQVVAVLGVLACGAHYVPIDPEQPELRVARILAQAGARVVLDARAYGTAAAWSRPLASPRDVDPGATAYVIFTSGSTGEPKGVEVTHAAAANTIDDLVERFAIGGDDRTLALSALDFDLSVFDIFAALMAGGTVVCIDDAQRRDPAAWIALMRAHGVSVVDCVPPLLDMLLRAGERDPLPPSLRLVLTGGDWVGVDLPGRLRAQRPDCRFVGLGGATEAAIYSNLYEVRGALPAGWPSIPYGTPLRNQRFRIVDAQGRDCPDWVAGELWIGGAGVARGYRGDPERTAQRFVEHAGLRWYRTGDRARYRPDGNVEFLGRTDDQVKLRGFRIELGEIEAAFGEHPAVRRATALVQRGAATPQLCAAVVVDRPVGVDELGAFAARRLPAHMCCDRVVLVDALPLTANGKVDRRALEQRFAAAGAAADRVAPRTALEDAIAHVWSQVLDGVPVGVEDDLFLLGGDSLLATTVVGRLREGLDTDAISVRDVLGHPTVAGLAARLAAGDDGSERLEQVAELFLEIERMTDDELEHELRDGDRARAPGR